MRHRKRAGGIPMNNPERFEGMFISTKIIYHCREHSCNVRKKTYENICIPNNHHVMVI